MSHANVVPYTHMQLARRLRRYARDTAAPESMVRTAYREGIKQLDDRSPESVSYEFGRQFRGHVPTGSTAA